MSKKLGLRVLSRKAKEKYMPTYYLPHAFYMP